MTELPLPGYGQTSLGDRIRSLDVRQLRTLVDHEDQHGRRVPPAPGNPAAAPPSSDTAAGSPVGEATSAEGTTPLRHGVAEQTPQRGRP